MPTYDVDVAGKTYEVDAPDPNTAWRWANQHHTDKTQRMAAATAETERRTREEFKQSEADRPWLDRAVINIGAGMHTIGEGARQLGAKIGLGEGVSDEELRASRATKQELAEGTTGGGVLQTVGEIAPTLLVPGGMAMRGARALPGAWAAHVAANAPRALAIGENAAVGAGLGALMPTTSDESRLMNAGLGGAGGAVGTVAGQFLGDKFRLLTKAGRAQAKNERLGKGINKALEEAGENPAEVYSRLRPPKRPSAVAGDIPMTAAERSGSLGLARAELAHRGMAPEIYGQHQRAQAQGVWEAARRAGAEGNDAALARATADRAGATDPMREEALRLAGRWSHVAEPLQAQVDDLWRASVPGSPQRGLAKLAQELLSENPTPAQMYEFRKVLTNKLSGPMTPGDDVAAIVKGSQREVMQLVKALDDRLDEAADNTWSPYLMEYADRSKPVTSARAQQQITEQLGTAPQIGGVPEVTGHRLRQAVRKFGTNKQGFERLTPEAQARYGDVQSVLTQIEEPMRALKKAGTGGGGSQTAMQRSVVDSALLTFAKAKVPGVGRALDVIGSKLDEPARRELAEMLIDPAATAQAIRAALTAGAPLSPAQRAFLASMQSAGTGAGLALTPTQ